MGGKNPPKPPKHQDHSIDGELTQKQSKFLFLCTAEFYGAHADLETIVIDESQGLPISESELQNLRRRFGRIQVLIDDELDVLSLCDSAFGLSPQWATYVKDQIISFKKLRLTMSRLNEALASESVISACECRALQGSLYFDGRNSEVRTLSILFTRTLLRALAVHDDFVEESNKTLMKSAA